MAYKIQEVEALPFFKLLKVRGYNRVCFSHYNVVDVKSGIIFDSFKDLK